MNTLCAQNAQSLPAELRGTYNYQCAKRLKKRENLYCSKSGPLQTPGPIAWTQNEPAVPNNWRSEQHRNMEGSRPTNWQLLSLTESEEAGAESHVVCFTAPCVLSADHPFCRQRRCRLTHFWSRKWKVCFFALTSDQMVWPCGCWVGPAVPSEGVL